MPEKVKKSTLLMLLAFILAAAALFSGCHPWRIAPRPAPTPSPVLSEEPTEAPTEAPTAEITAKPVDTQIPDTAAPTETAVSEPATDEPLTGEPLTGEPSDEPSAAPTEALTPTPKPTEAPTPTPKPTEAPTPAPEADIPPFSAKSITDKKTYTNSIFASTKVTMVNVWATTCGPCIQELPEIQQLANNYAGRGLKVLTVLGDSQTPGKIQEALNILNNIGVSLPTLVNNASVKTAFPVRGYPKTFFIDSNGNILKTEGKAHSYNEWVNIIEGLL